MPLGLFNPSDDADGTVVKFADDTYRSISFNLFDAESPAKILLYRLNQQREIPNLDKPDIQVIMTWKWADRLHTTKCFVFEPIILFQNEASISLEVRKGRREDLRDKCRVFSTAQLLVFFFFPFTSASVAVAKVVRVKSKDERELPRTGKVLHPGDKVKMGVEWGVF